MTFWNVSIVTVLILAMIELLKVLWCPKHRRLSHTKFLSGGNTWKTMEIQVFIIKPKSCMVAMATYKRADWWKWTFLNGKYIEKIHKAVTPNSKPFWRYAVILVWGHKVPPRTCIGLTLFLFLNGYYYNLLLLLFLLLAESQKAYTRKTITGILLYCTKRMTRVVIKTICL